MRLLFVIAFLLATSAVSQAAVLVIQGGNQHATEGLEFGLVRVRIVDDAGAPVPRASVRYWLPATYGIGFSSNSNPGCFFDAGYNCHGVADSQGEATLQAVRAIVPGAWNLPVTADGPDGTWLGRADIALHVDALANPPKVSPYRGVGQRVVAGSDMERFSVRVTDADGRPIPGATVTFAAGNGARTFLRGASSWESSATTDGGGYAESPNITAGPGLGDGTIVARYTLPGSTKSVWTAIGYTITTATGATSLPLQDLWWAGPAETGWGLAIAQHEDRLFSVLFVYDDAGRPTWQAFSDLPWYDRFFIAGGYGYRPRGSPFWAYDPTRFGLTRVSWMHLTFEDTEHLRLILQRPDVPNVEKRLVRQDFSSPTRSPRQGLGDLWWGGEPQAGWGMAILEQPGGLFTVWFTYDSAGIPVWYVMSEGQWIDQRTWGGPVFRTQGPTWPAYDPTRLTVSRVGDFTLRFDDDFHAIFRYNVDGHSGTETLARQPF